MEQKILDILVDVCGDDEVIEDKDINLFDSGFFRLFRSNRTITSN